MIGEQALALAGELGDAELGALARHWLLYDLAEMGELEEARRRQAELDLLAEELQQPLYRHSSLAWRCVWAGLAGASRRPSASPAIRPPGRTRRKPRRAGPLHRSVGRPAARAGPPARALPEIERLAGEEPPRPPGAASCRSHISTRATGRAPRPHTSEHSAAGGGGAPDDALADRHRLAGRGSRPARDPDGGEQLYAELEPYADRLAQWSFTGNAGSVHRLLGRTAAIAGWHDRARGHFEAALRRHAALGAAPLLARTRCDYGEFLLRGTRAERPTARRLLRQARLTARRLGMAGVAARADGTDGRTADARPHEETQPVDHDR